MEKGQDEVLSDSLKCPFCAAYFANKSDFSEHLKEGCKKYRAEDARKTGVLAKIRLNAIQIPEQRAKSAFKNIKPFLHSVENYGLLQPIIVVLDENGDFWLADGANRLEGLKKLGEKEVEAKVIRGRKKDAVIQSVIANKLRGRTDPASLVLTVKALRDQYGCKVAEISMATGYDERHIYRLLRIASSGREVLDKLVSGKIGIKDAYELCKSKPASAPRTDTVSPPPLEVTEHEQEVGKPLSFEDLGVKRSLEKPMEDYKERFIPVKPEESEEEDDYRHLKCIYCGVGFQLGEKPKWLPVHGHHKTEALNILEKYRVERGESRNSSPGT
jgi:ParB family chromosome partitioning protein